MAVADRVREQRSAAVQARATRLPAAHGIAPKAVERRVLFRILLPGAGHCEVQMGARVHTMLQQVRPKITYSGVLATCIII